MGDTSAGSRARAGGTPTIEDVYDLYVYDVHAFFLYSGLRREDAEDLTQLTFERSIRAWHRYDPARAAVRTWLLAIAKNLLIDHRRRGARQHQVPLREEHEPLAEDAALAGHELNPALQAALQSLSPREREVIALRFGGDLSGPEIAGMTGLTLANVQQIASRALRKLRLALNVRDRQGV